MPRLRAPLYRTICSAIVLVALLLSGVEEAQCLDDGGASTGAAQLATVIAADADADRSDAPAVHCCPCLHLYAAYRIQLPVRPVRWSAVALPVLQPVAVVTSHALAPPIRPPIS